MNHTFARIRQVRVAPAYEAPTYRIGLDGLKHPVYERRGIEPLPPLALTDAHVASLEAE